VTGDRWRRIVSQLGATGRPTPTSPDPWAERWAALLIGVLVLVGAVGTYVVIMAVLGPYADVSPSGPAPAPAVDHTR
jgi:hypothetical protein